MATWAAGPDNPPPATRTRDLYFVDPLHTAASVIHVVARVMWILFAMWAGPNNWTTHTYFHGNLTGELLSGRWTAPWVVEMLWLGASMLALFVLVTIATEDGLHLSTYPQWWLAMFAAVCTGGLWMANMVWLLLKANRADYPLNIANSHLWGSAFDNVTEAQISRYRPLPQDVLTPGQLAVNPDFIWLWASGTVVWLSLVVMLILYTVRWVRLERARQGLPENTVDDDGLTSEYAFRGIGDRLGALRRYVQPITGQWWVPGPAASAPKRSKVD